MEFLADGLVAILGAGVGGFFRLAPEILKFFDRRNERKHELGMFDKQVELEKTRGQQKLAEIGASHDMAVDTGVINAFESAINQQTEMIKASGASWVAWLSATVRPFVTYWLLFLYSIYKTSMFIAAYRASDDFATAMQLAWTPDDVAMLAGVVNYWFIDRTLQKRGL